MEVEDILNAVDIVDIASKYTELEERGGEYWGISPITYPPENTPSFSCRRETGKFYDFSSGVGGSAITLVQYCEKVSAAQAIKILGEYIGADVSSIKVREKMAATLTCKRFSKPKSNKKPSKTTVLPDDYMIRYEKDDSKLDIWRQEGISDASLDRFQVYYDGFSNRLVYPIRDIAGNIVNVGGRTIDPDWKEKKQRKYTYFFGWNGSINTIYGLAENMESIKSKREVIIFEGCKSVLLADTWGIDNTAAILTSHLSINQLMILVKLGVRVVFALDKEVRIRDDHNIQKLKRYVNVEYLYDWSDMLDEKDAPVDKGLEVFKKLYGNRLAYR